MSSLSLSPPSPAPVTRNLLSVSGIRLLWTFRFYRITHCVVPTFLPQHRALRTQSVLEPGSAFIPLFGLKSIPLCGYILLCLPIDRCWTSELFPPFGPCDSSCKEHLWASVGLSTGPQDLGWILLKEESLGHTETLCLTCGGTTQLFHGGGELIFLIALAVMCNTHLSVINIRLASGEYKLHGVGTV